MLDKVCGSVVPGKQEGRHLGFPTANLLLKFNSLRPAAGIYACWVEGVGTKLWPGVLVSGVYWEAEGMPRVEVYLIDFDGDIYGQALQISVVQKLRDVIIEPDIIKLKEQIAADIVAARRVLKVMGV